MPPNRDHIVARGDNFDEFDVRLRPNARRKVNAASDSFPAALAPVAPCRFRRPRTQRAAPVNPA